MSKVTRYNFGMETWRCQDPQGEFVKYSDYELLEDLGRIEADKWFNLFLYSRDDLMREFKDDPEVTEKINRIIKQNYQKFVIGKEKDNE